MALSIPSRYCLYVLPFFPRPRWSIGIRPAATLPAGTSVLVDCKAQTTRANGTLAPVSLDTDYFALLPGMNTLTLSGAAGSCEHEPEWMI